MVATGARPPEALAYERWMEIAAEEYTRILQLLDGLSAEQWETATDCAGWSVRDVVAHLCGAAAGTASLRELIRQARIARRMSGGDLIDRINQVQVAEARGLSAAQLRARLASAGKRGVATRRRVPPPVPRIRVPFGPPLGTRPLGYLLGRIYTRDAWMHRVDLARATGSPLQLTTGHDAAIVEDVVAEWGERQGAAVELSLQGPAGGFWRLGTGQPATAIEMDAVEFARTLSGRATAEGLLAVPVPF
jgi:uncharacterized protein (TIGR03083 family)